MSVATEATFTPRGASLAVVKLAAAAGLLLGGGAAACEDINRLPGLQVMSAPHQSAQQVQQHTPIQGTVSPSAARSIR